MLCSFKAASALFDAGQERSPNPRKVKKPHVSIGSANCATGIKDRAESLLWYLRDVDPSLLKRARGGVVGTEVPVLAPVAAESTVHTGQAPGGRKEELRSRSPPWEVTTVTDRPSKKSRLSAPQGKIILLERCFETTKVCCLGKLTPQRQSLNQLMICSIIEDKLGFAAHHRTGVN